MKKTFATTMPDRIGAFLQADRLITKLGLNITRVSYNRAVDAHMLFIEVEGDKSQLITADKELTALGYLSNETYHGNILLMQFKLLDKPGALLPILELINKYNFNISYISSQETNTDFQYFKMGLYVENEDDVSEFMKQATLLCDIKILDYKSSEKILDNTVFYISFANDIAAKIGLSEDNKRKLMVNTNRIMQILDERNKPPYKTFDYIGRIADMLMEHSKGNYHPRISIYQTNSGHDIILIEPPCGSNTCVFVYEDELLFVDAGFSCYSNELLQVLRAVIPGFDKKAKKLLLTHSDVDHVGNPSVFDKIILSRPCYDDFLNQSTNEPAWREENPLHMPYVKITKLLTGYETPALEKCEFIGDCPDFKDMLIAKAGILNFHDLSFEIYVGCGGHVNGELIAIERHEKIAFTGDIFVNIKGFSPEQAKFNKLAPYLMTSVDTNPSVARREREEFFSLLDEGHWKIFGGHGSVYEYVK